MELCDRYLRYLSALCEGTLPAPAALSLSGETPEERALSLQAALQALSVPDFLRLCAEAAGDDLPESLLASFDEEAFSRALLEALAAAPDAPPEPDEPPAPDPDAGKHAFEVFCDCIALDDSLVSYLIDVLKRGDRAAFFKLSQITTRLDLDPDEFLFWLFHREDYGSDEERACAAIMDACLARLREEGQGELLAALLSGDRTTFERFRVDAPELCHLPAATFEWFAQNYLDRDYPLRFILKCSGIASPAAPKEEP